MPQCNAYLAGASPLLRRCERSPDHSAAHADAHGIWTEDEAVYPTTAAAADPVHNPAHYTQGKIEVWDFIEDQQLGFLAGNVIKYVCRYRHKGNPKQDLLKARAYLDRLIQAEAS